MMSSIVRLVILDFFSPTINFKAEKTRSIAAEDTGVAYKRAATA